MSDNAITRHFFNGFIRLHILHHAAREAIYGIEIAEELSRHGYRLSPGTLYPTLHGLEQAGYLRCKEEVIAGRRRKYYRATSAGRRLLAEARLKLQELVAEVLDGQDREFQKIKQKHRADGTRRRARPR